VRYGSGPDISADRAGNAPEYSSPSEKTLRLAVAHQPNWLPRLKTICKIAVADTWLVLDDVQYASREWQNRCRVHPVKPSQLAFWMTLPVSRPHGRASAIRDVRIVDAAVCRRQVAETVRHAYRASPYWDDVSSVTDAALGGTDDSLAEMALGSARAVLRGIAAPVRPCYAAAFAAPTSPSTRLAAICERSGATHYLAGPGSRAYLKTAELEHAGVRVIWQDWTKDMTDRGFGPPELLADWSCLDFIARFGLHELSLLVGDLRQSYRERPSQG
jgi:WbqC-like protein